MVIAVCTCSREEYEAIAGWAKEYGDSKGISIAVQWFESHEEYVRCFEKEPFPITFLSFDDIVNQELAIAVRSVSKTGQMIWLGEDGRFGVSSFRVNAANFLLKPVTRADGWDSMERSLVKMNFGQGAAGRSGCVSVEQMKINGRRQS